ncbi:MULTISPECIES: response regulator [unclassified Coleofasciculus]|uniref:response regulator n=1 Tax=unclassified Coleofasciculus TaxID=2692782 RepID=UPI00187DF4FF|nr:MULTISPECIES: response regulator [unclassified Coleofasciculus]MBE9125701.1 response regulator [Coleofasciculus sp. LEGE 07081]MBE9148312.1 response regulator [Coleofasciculus sp. LEGE 07092]
MANARILIVDDEKNIRQVIAQSLDPLDYQIMTAVDGEDALKQLQTEDYDLILLDLRMPGMDGLEVLRRVVEMQSDIQVIIISGHGTVENAVEAMKLGAADFLEKPFTPQELRNLVADVLKRESLSMEQNADYKGAMKLAKSWANKQRLDKAIAHVKQAIGCDPSQSEAFTLLGELQEVDGNFCEALKNYRVAVSLDPTYKPAQNNLDRVSRSPKNRPTMK